MRRYTVLLIPAPDGSAYNVTGPALPGCFTWGATVEEALARARDAIMVYLHGETDVPTDPGTIVTTVEVAEPAAVA